MKIANILILVGVVLLSSILVSGIMVEASASRSTILQPNSDFVAGVDRLANLPQDENWGKFINDQPWEPRMVITVETSDTIKIVDVIHTLTSSVLIETWNPNCLKLLEASIDPPIVTPTQISPENVIWDIPQGPPEVVTVTKYFHVEPSTWVSTTLNEEFNLGGVQYEPRPVVFQKRLPELWIDSFFDVSVQAGDTATFTLEYGNSGGYENNVSIMNVFPDSALFLSSNPPPDDKDPGGHWVKWQVGDLAGSSSGSIDVGVAIQAGLQPSTTIEILDTIFNHVGNEADETFISYHVASSPEQEGDIYIRDNPVDDGSVASSAPWWVSPDIWVRNDGDCSKINHQNPATGVATTICIRLINRMATSVSNIDIDLYFANAALGLSWPVSWNVIGTINIPVLAGMSEIVEAIPLNTPETSGHFCLLARVDSLEDPIGSGPDTVAPADLVHNNNNISLRNLNIIDFPEVNTCADLTDTLYSTLVSFDIVNIEDASVWVDIVINSIDFPLAVGDITLEPGALWGRWTSLTNFNQIGFTLKPTAFPASINGVLMDPYEVTMLLMGMTYPGNIEFKVSVIEWQEGLIIGGINYVRLLPTCTYLPLIIHTSPPPLPMPAGFRILQDMYFNRLHFEDDQSD